METNQSLTPLGTSLANGLAVGDAFASSAESFEPFETESSGEESSETSSTASDACFESPDPAPVFSLSDPSPTSASASDSRMRLSGSKSPIADADSASRSSSLPARTLTSLLPGIDDPNLAPSHTPVTTDWDEPWRQI